MTSGPKLPTGQTVNWNEEKQMIVYSNLMGISMTPFDIGILFGQIGKATATDIEGLVQAKVLLSAEQVQNLIVLLSIALKQYVEGNGPLRGGGALNEEAFMKELEGNTFNGPKDAV
jgi:hypothetical protein